MLVVGGKKYLAQVASQKLVWDLCVQFHSVTFDFDVVTLTFKILSGLYILETIWCRTLITGENIGWKV